MSPVCRLSMSKCLVHEVLSHLASLSILDMTTSTATGDIMPRVLSWIQCPRINIKSTTCCFTTVKALLLTCNSIPKNNNAMDHWQERKCLQQQTKNHNTKNIGYAIIHEEFLTIYCMVSFTQSHCLL